MSSEIPFAELRAVLLDAGNTLVGMDLGIVAAALAERGVAVTPDALERAEAGARPALSRRIGAGRSSESTDVFSFYLRATLKGLGVVASGGLDGLASEVASEIKRKIATERLWSRVLPGVPEALLALREGGLTLGVVSNSDGTVERALATVGLGSLLDVVVDSHVVGIEKPDPGIFRKALELLDVAPHEAAHLGDLYAADVVGARAAGVHAVLLDPYGDWRDVDCATTPDLATFARDLLAARS